MTLRRQEDEVAVADSKLIEELIKVSKENHKLIRCTTYEAPAVPPMEITSWRMDEHKYNKVPCPFPTLARGLFTAKVGEEGEDEVVHKIVVRGYDKFFNIGEVGWTQVSHMRYTRP